MADRSRSQYQAFLVPDSAWGPSALATDSSYTGIDPLPDTPQPASTSDLALSASGTFASPAATLTVTTQQGGLPCRDRGATFRWSDGTYTYGWDAPTVLVGYETVVWETSNSKRHPSILPLPSGALLAVWAYGALQKQIYTSTRTAGVWSAPAEITTDSAWALGCSPCLCALPDGRILLFAWVTASTTGATTATVRCLSSSDSGATWTLTGPGCLSDSVDLASCTLYRLQAAANGGQILLMAWLHDDTAPPGEPNQIRQYASSDGGCTFSLVWASDTHATAPYQGGTYPAVVALPDGGFCVSWIDHSPDPVAYTLSSAYLSLGSLTATAVASLAAPEEMLLVCDESGSLYLSTRLAGAAEKWVAYTSVDSGATWTAMARSSLANGSGVWWSDRVGNTYPKYAASCWQNGRWLILSSYAGSASNVGYSLSLYALGGYTSATMPGYDAQRVDSLQVTWGQTYRSLDLPAVCGWTKTTTGTTTESVSSGTLALTTNVASSIVYSYAPTGTVNGGIIAAWTATTGASGTLRIRLTCADGSHGYALQVSLSGTTATITDRVSGSTLATVTIPATTQLSWLASITSGKVQVWWRQAGNADALRGWTVAVASTSMTDAAGATYTANLVEWGLSTIGSGSFAAVDYVTDGGGTYGFTGTGLGSASFPGALLGRRYSGAAVSLDGSTSILASNGPTYGGESWTIGVRYEYGPQNLFPTVAPSPRQPLRLDSSGTNDLIFDLEGDGTEATSLLGRPLALALLGTNAHSATLYGWNGAAWVSFLTWDASITSGAGYVRVGRIVTVTSGGTAGYVTRNQLAGATLDLGGGKLRKVLYNSEGQIGNSTNPAALQIDADGTEGTSGTCTLYAASAVAVVAQPVNYRRWQLRFTATSTPEGYLEIGQALLGSLHLLARRPSNGRQIEVVQQAQTARPPGGPRSWRVLGPSVRRVGIELGELLPSSQIFGTSPDTVALSTVGNALASLHGAAYSTMGIIEEQQGNILLYCGNVPQVSSNTATTMLLDPRFLHYGRIVEPGTLQVVRGDEGSATRGEVLTLTGIILETEP